MDDAVDIASPEARGLQDHQVGPASSTVAELSALCRRLLQVGEIELDKDFLELGGQSVTVMALIQESHSLWGVDLHLLDVLDGGTIRELAALIDERRRNR